MPPPPPPRPGLSKAYRAYFLPAGSVHSSIVAATCMYHHRNPGMGVYDICDRYMCHPAVTVVLIMLVLDLSAGDLDGPCMQQSRPAAPTGSFFGLQGTVCASFLTIVHRISFVATRYLFFFELFFRTVFFSLSRWPFLIRRVW